MSNYLLAQKIKKLGIEKMEGNIQHENKKKKDVNSRIGATHRPLGLL